VHLWIQSVIVKTYQQVFLASLPVTNNPGDDAIKYQHRFEQEYLSDTDPNSDYLSYEYEYIYQIRDKTIGV
jgi:hypothetical protein